MVGIYTITNTETKNNTPINETLLLKTIKSLDGRHKELSVKWIEIWEDLESKKFDKNKQLDNL